MSDAELDALADAQATELRNRAWSREQFVEALNDYVIGLPNEVASI